MPYVPPGWELVSLGELGKYINGRAFKPEDWEPTGLPIVRIQNLTDVDSPYNYYSKPVDQRYYIKNGDLLISWSATLGAYIWDRGDAILNQHIFKVEENRERVNKLFLKYAVQHALEELSQHTHGTTMRHVTKGKFEAFKVPVPHALAEQRRIVARIEALFAELQEGRRLKTLIDTDNGNLLSGALEEVIDTVFSDSPEIPVLGDFASAFNGRASGEGDSDVRVFKTKHVYPFNLRLDEPSFMKVEQVASCPPNRFLRPDDVLLCNIARGTLGRPAYVESVDDKWTTDTSVMILRTGERCLGKWLFYYLYSKRGQDEIAAREKGIIFADKRGQTHLYPKDMLTVPVPLPPPSQQRELVRYLDAIQYSQRQIKESQAELQTYFDEFEQAILIQAFSGEL